MRFFQYLLSTIGAVSLFATIALAQTPSPAPSPAQTSSKSVPAKKKIARPATPSAKQEAQKLNPVVVTATRIEQPIDQIGTTITVVEAPQIEQQKIQSVQDVLRQVPGVQVTQTGSPGSETDVMIRGASA